MLYKVFDFADKEVSEVMVPRPDVVALSIELPPEQALAAVIDSPYTRYPVYRETLDNVVGILHVRDLFSALVDRGIANVVIEEIVRDAYIVPETKDLAAMLTEFRRTNQHMAIVVDEYGAMQGIVTLEDLLEEIVGEIEDEFDLPGRVGRARRRRHDPHRRHVPHRRLQRAVRDRTDRRGLPHGRGLRLRPARPRAGDGRLDRLRRHALRRARGRGLADPEARGHVHGAVRRARSLWPRVRARARRSAILGGVAPTAFAEQQLAGRVVASPRLRSTGSTAAGRGGAGRRRPDDREEAGEARAAHRRRPARSPAVPVRGGRAGGADRRPARDRGRGRDQRQGRPDLGASPQAPARDRPGARRRRERRDHRGLVQPGLARRQAHARDERPPARPVAPERVHRPLVRRERRLGDRGLRARLPGERGRHRQEAARARGTGAAVRARSPGPRPGRRRSGAPAPRRRAHRPPPAA